MGTSRLVAVNSCSPAIFCVHELNAEIGALLNIDRPTGVEYLRLLGVQAHGCLAAGDVHGIGREQVPAIRAELGEDVSVAVLVRNPELRLLSQLALFRRLAAFSSLWEIDYVDQLIEERRLPLPSREVEHRLFVHAANMLNAICDEVQIGTIYRLEDLTTRPARLRQLVHEMSGGRVNPSRRWCSSMTRSAPVNSHRRAVDSGGIGLQPWQREVVRLIVRSDAWKLYADLGYEAPAWL
jgi:hypothetical protein